MINIKLNDVLYQFPENWNEVTLDKFIKVTEIKLDNTEEIERDLLILSALTDIPFDIIDELPYTEYKRLSQLCKFIMEDDKSKVSYEFTLDNVDYIMQNDITKITTAEFIDMDSLISDKDNMMHNLHILLAILYRPKVNGKIEKYNSDTLMERAELFNKKMTCNYAISAMVFSLALGQVCLEFIPDSLDNLTIEQSQI